MTFTYHECNASVIQILKILVEYVNQLTIPHVQQNLSSEHLMQGNHTVYCGSWSFGCS